MKNNIVFKMGIILIVLAVMPKTIISQNFKTIGYLPTYRFEIIDDIDIKKLTHLNLSFANPDSIGNLTIGGQDIKPIVQKAHDLDVDVFIALAGAGAQLSQWAPWIKEDNRSVFIDNIISYCKQNNLDGIDVDLEWENINEDYSGFVLALKKATSLNGLKLSAALPGTHRYPQISNEALKAFDWINIMAYDLTGPWSPNKPGPHSPLSFTIQSINYWINQGVEKHRMVIGVPFYGYDFTNQNNVTAVTFAEMVQRDTLNAFTDKVGQIYYNGLPTIKYKTGAAISKTSGIMIWEIGQDIFNRFSLLKRINEIVVKNTSSKTLDINQNNIKILSQNPMRKNVKLKIIEPQNIKLVLFSNFQKVLKTKQYLNITDIAFNIQHLPGGFYYLHIQGEKFSETIKLVKTDF